MLLVYYTYTFVPVLTCMYNTKPYYMQNMYMNVGYAKLFSGKLIWKFARMGKLSFLIAISRFLFNFLSSVPLFSCNITECNLHFELYIIKSVFVRNYALYFS